MWAAIVARMHAGETLRPVEPLPLHHSWPLFEQGLRFDLGCVLDWPSERSALPVAAPFDPLELARRGIGAWECDLSDDSLAWSAEVYDIFGLARDSGVRRAQAVALYEDDSRVMMERLRAHAIRHRRGFTVDVEIRPGFGSRRWVRLIAAPVCEEDRVVRLHGLKMCVA